LFCSIKKTLLCGGASYFGEIMLFQPNSPSALIKDEPKNHTMILHLWHGRLNPDHDPNGWGFSGPIFKNQLNKIVVDADNNITVYAESDKEKNIPIAHILFDKEEGMWTYGSAWYGDISIADHDDNRKCTDNVIVEHSKGATLFSWFQMTYGTRDRCGSSVCEDDAIEGAQEGELVFYALKATDAYGQPANYEGEYKLHGA